MANDGQIAEPLKPMLKKRLFVALRKASPAEQMLPHVAEHLRYMNRLETEGFLFASGPFVQEGVQVGDGLTILQTAGRDLAPATTVGNEFFSAVCHDRSPHTRCDDFHVVCSQHHRPDCCGARNGCSRRSCRPYPRTDYGSAYSANRRRYGPDPGSLPVSLLLLCYCS